MYVCMYIIHMKTKKAQNFRWRFVCNYCVTAVDNKAHKALRCVRMIYVAVSFDIRDRYENSFRLRNLYFLNELLDPVGEHCIEVLAVVSCVPTGYNGEERM